MNKEQKIRHAKLRELGCIVCLRKGYPETPASIHHCETGAGGRKDDDLVLPLCHHHHQGTQGIHTLSRNVWAVFYGTEQYLMQFAAYLLGEIKEPPSRGLFC